ncbi:DMT family transporter [candidate division WOR-3 bacterium]|nr:DMT family transporter [candidate division WOR-3 bacterium]
MPLRLPYLGEILALLSALFWAFAVILFKKSGETRHPLTLNIFKNLLATILLIPTIVLFREPLLPRLSLHDYVCFIASGILGMAIGDTLFFASLNRIGASLSAIVSYMYSPALVILSILLLKETLSPFQFIGIFLILAALLTATRIELPQNLTRGRLLTGVLLGVLSTLATAIGVIIIKPLLAQNSILWVTLIRLFAALISLFIITLLLPQRRVLLSSLFIRKGIGYPILATVLGIYLALTVWLGGMKFTRVSIAAPLNQLSNIFIFILAALLLKEPITLRKIGAIVIAFAGALLVVFA